MYQGNYCNEMKEKLLDLYEIELARKAVMQKELKTLPDGRLVIKQNRDKYFMLYQANGTKLEGITRDKDRSRQHARKCFLENQLEICQLNCDAMEAALRSVRSGEMKRDKPVRPGAVSRLMQIFPDGEFRYSAEALAWMNAPYERNPYRPENLRYMARNGLMVRSKSERSIADSLLKNCVAFRYEAKTIICGRVYYPDFTILCSDGTILIWEHFGLDDKEDYFLQSCRKIRNYRKAGYDIHRTLICTYESDLLSEEKLDFLIRRYVW